MNRAERRAAARAGIRAGDDPLGRAEIGAPAPLRPVAGRSTGEQRRARPRALLRPLHDASERRGRSSDCAANSLFVDVRPAAELR